MTTPIKDLPAKNAAARPAPTPVKETRADVTDRIAREIIQEEAEYRRSLTERLRAARLKFEAQKAAAAPARKAPAKPRTRKSS